MSATSSNTSPSGGATSRRDDGSETKTPSLARVVLCVDDDSDYCDLVRRMVSVLPSRERRQRSMMV